MLSITIHHHAIISLTIYLYSGILIAYSLFIHLCCVVQVIRKIGHYLKMNITVPDEYIDGFVKANNTFLYQLVFDPINRKVVPLNPYPENLELSTLSYAGVYPSTQRNKSYSTVCDEAVPLTTSMLISFL